METDQRGKAQRQRRATLHATVAVGAGVGIVVAVALGAFLVIRANAPTVSFKHSTTDEEYCSLAKTLQFANVADGVSTNHDYLDVTLGVLPKNGPPAVNDDVAKLRSQLTAGDYAGATSTGRDLDAATPTVCP